MNNYSEKFEKMRIAGNLAAKTLDMLTENIKEGDSIKIGIRPEHLILNAKTDSLWESKVFVVEKLGSGTYLYLEKEGDPLVVQTDGDTNIKVGDTVKIDFDPFRCHLFDNKGISFKNS